MIDPDRDHVTQSRERDIDLAADVAVSAPANPSWDRGSVPPPGGNDARQGWVAEFGTADHVAVRGALALWGVMIGPAFPHVLVAAQGGDEQLFEMLWRDLHPAMLRYLQVVAPAAAEDLAADTWIRVIGALSRFVGDEPGFRAWVFTIARHQALDWHRWTNRQRVEQVPGELADRWATPDDPAVEALDGWSTQAALALIAELPPAQAEVVALRVVGGLNVAQVAHIVGKSPNAVRVLSHRGLRRLARQLRAAHSAPRTAELDIYEL